MVLPPAMGSLGEVCGKMQRHPCVFFVLFRASAPFVGGWSIAAGKANATKKKRVCWLCQEQLRRVSWWIFRGIDEDGLDEMPSVEQARLQLSPPPFSTATSPPACLLQDC